MSAGMFDPLATGSARVAAVQELEWRVIIPAPEDAPARPPAHPTLGRPSMRWEYRDGANWLSGYVCRFDGVSASSPSTSMESSSGIEDGGKEIRSLVFAEHKRRGRQWRWQGFPKPRPLYGLDRLAARPEAPVVICEGEKAADAAGKLLLDYVAVTSPGGRRRPRLCRLVGARRLSRRHLARCR
jgi:putative DNA primase/helicase